MTVRALLPDFNEANPLYTGATVTVYEADAAGAATVTLATVYDAITGGGTLSNPLTLDGDGKWLTPPYVAVPVIMSVTGATVSDHSTGVAGPPSSFSGQVEFTGIPTTTYGLTSFTPHIFYGEEGSTGTNYFSAHYYKIGRMVFWVMSVKISIRGSTGDPAEMKIRMEGAPQAATPAAPTGGSLPSWGVNVQYQANLTGIGSGADAALHALLRPADMFLRFRVGSADETADFLDYDNIQNDTYLVLSGQYVATA